MIVRSYIQLRDSLEYVEEFWIHLIESIYGKIQTGRLQFDRVWKTLFHQKIMHNRFIQHFLNEISEQYDLYYQNCGSKTTPSYMKNDKNVAIILTNSYDSLIKLETDLHQDHVIEDLLKLQGLIDEQNNVGYRQTDSMLQLQ